MGSAVFDEELAAAKRDVRMSWQRHRRAFAFEARGIGGKGASLDRDGTPDAAAAAGGAAAAAPDIVSGPFCPHAEIAAAAKAKAPPRDADFHTPTTLVRLIDIVRILSTMPHAAGATTLTNAEYDAFADAVFERVETTIDAWLQDDFVDIDTHRTGGLLELSFPDGSKIVLNKQPPLHELWLAARSGGYHYRYAEGAWRDTRDGRELLDVLSTCASEQAGRPLRFDERA